MTKPLGKIFFILLLVLFLGGGCSSTDENVISLNNKAYTENIEHLIIKGEDDNQRLQAEVYNLSSKVSQLTEGNPLAPLGYIYIPCKNKDQCPKTTDGIDREGMYRVTPNQAIQMIIEANKFKYLAGEEKPEKLVK